MNEEPVVFGSDGQLVGTLTFPADSTTIGPAVVLVNAGVIHRIGPHRFYVKLARRLAQSGHVVLRFDLSGSGDSGSPSQPLPMLEQAVDDIRSALDVVRGGQADKRVSLIGICSGAMNAFHAALADEGVGALVMFDGNMYPTWGTRWRRQANRMRWRSLRRSVGLLAASVSRNGLFGAITAAKVDLFGVPSEDSARLPIEQYAGGLKKLVGRGAKIYLLFSASFPAYYSYSKQFSDKFRAYGLSSEVATRFLPNVDHVITLRPSQDLVIGAIDRWLS
jgi:alpha-beta hydrolase superfamily lysophospholipase